MGSLRQVSDDAILRCFIQIIPSEGLNRDRRHLPDATFSMVARSDLRSVLSPLPHGDCACRNRAAGSLTAKWSTLHTSPDIEGTPMRLFSLSIILGLFGLLTTLHAADPYTESAGTVVMEAENADSITTGSGTHGWQSIDSGTAMQALPDSGTNYNTGYATSSPRLSFRVNFATTGTYHIWVRGAARGGSVGSSDSCHVGLDGAAVASADRISNFSSSLDWSQSTMDGVNATVNIASPGEHTIELWMREDGFAVDRLMLTTDSSFVPSGVGPAESPRGTPPPPPSGAYIESDGEVVMEAENADSITTGSGTHSWQSIDSGTAMQALPDSGTNYNTGYATSSPRLSFRVNFATTGTYHIWVRGAARGGSVGSSDSCHVGLDGAAVASADRISNFSSSLDWSQSTMDGVNATVNIASPGEHTIELWMREDGFAVDRLMLTTDSSFVPSGVGPAESPRSGGNTAPEIAPLDPISVNSDTFTITASVTDNEGDPVSYSWSKVPGPSTAESILVSGQNSNSLTARVAINGTYRYRLTATDGPGLSSTAEIDVTVSAPTTSVYGRVIDGSSAPSPGANIQLQWRDASNSTVSTTTTDSSGNWSFNIVADLLEFQVLVKGR